MPEGTTIIPASAVTTLSGTFGDLVAANAVAILGILFFGVAVAFVVRWFNKSTKRLKA